MSKQRSSAERLLMVETKKLHDMLLGPDHCNRSKLIECPAYLQCIPQASENVKKIMKR